MISTFPNWSELHEPNGSHCSSKDFWLNSILLSNFAVLLCNFKFQTIIWPEKAWYCSDIQVSKMSLNAKFDKNCDLNTVLGISPSAYRGGATVLAPPPLLLVGHFVKDFTKASFLLMFVPLSLAPPPPFEFLCTPLKSTNIICLVNNLDDFSDIFKICIYR